LRLGEVYDFLIREGTRAELRSKSQISRKLQSKQKEIKKLKASERKLFDKVSLKNPYSDTRILYGNPDCSVKSILVGIDISVGELLLVDRLRQRGQEIDLVISHHPLGVALAGLYDVIDLQTDLLNNLGIDYDVAKSFLDKRIGEVERSVHGSNHSRTVDAARLLGIPLMCCHTPADNHVVKYLQKLVDKKRPKTLENIIELLLKEPEYREAGANKAGPKILVGKAKDKAGKIFVDMTGGTEGSKEIFGRMSQAGVKTLLNMHLSEAHYNKVTSEHMNVIVAGHIASDSLGMNLLFDKLEKKGKFNIVECSGFRRYRR